MNSSNSVPNHAPQIPTAPILTTPQIPTAPTPGDDKASWRQYLLSERRRRVSTVEEPARLTQNISQILSPHTPGRVAFYLALIGEPDLGETLRRNSDLGWEIAVPASNGITDTIGWNRWPEATELADALAGCDYIFVPGLAVDRSGTRLGRGGGWYDRALADPRVHAEIFIVVHPEEVFPAGYLPREPHDHPVNGWVTANGWQRL